MSIVSGNVFLFLIAIFSFYLAYAGMRFARNRTGIANIFDWVAVGLMILSGTLMWCLAIFYFINNNSQYITLIIFWFIAIRLGYTDFRGYRNKSAIGKQRIARHLTNMLAGTIAVITAVLVTNIYWTSLYIMDTSNNSFHSDNFLVEQKIYCLKQSYLGKSRLKIADIIFFSWNMEI